MIAIVVKEERPVMPSEPWIIQIHNEGCECGCEAEDGKVGKWLGPRKMGSYRTKKLAQLYADRMYYIDHPWNGPRKGI